MPAIYMSFAFEPDDKLEQRMSKLYLGIISVGEQLYTYNAAVAELRKGKERNDAVLAVLSAAIEKRDLDLDRMRQQYDNLKELMKAEKEAGQLLDERHILKLEAEWNV